MQNLRVNEENLNKHKHTKLRVDRLAALCAVPIIAISSGVYAVKSYFNVKPNEGFSNIGIIQENDKKYKINEEKKDNFVMFETKGWKEGYSENLENNMNICNQFDISFGVILKTDSNTEKQIEADASSLKAKLEGKKVDCPIYLDIDNLAIQNNSDTLNDLCETFINDLNEEYKVGFKGSEESLSKIDLEDKEYSVFLNSDAKEITGNYDMCFSSRTNKVYTNKAYNIDVDEAYNIDIKIETREDNINDENYEPLKGIDVSTHQGEINWDKVKEQGVNYALLRINTFEFYHSRGDVHLDDQFLRNVEECKRLDIPFGVYSFIAPESIAEAKEEANELVDMLDKYEINPDMPVYIDCETKYLNGNPKLAADVCETMVKIVKESGRESSVYASKSIFIEMAEKNEYIANLEDKWVAYYKDDSTTSFEDYSTDRIGEMGNLKNVALVQVTQHGLMREAIKDGGYRTGDEKTTIGNVDFNYDITGISRESSDVETVGKSK